MRLALHIPSAPTVKDIVLHLYAAPDLSAGVKNPPHVSVIMRPSAAGVLFDMTTHATNLNASEMAVLRALGNRVNHAIEVHKALTPYTLARSILEFHGAHVTKDSTGRFRTVTTLKDGESHWELVGTGLTVTVGADDDEDFVRRAGKRMVANAMQDVPESAETLAKWFTGGMKLKKLSSGKAPDVIGLDALTVTKADKELAKTPIKKGRSDDGDE